MHQDRPRPLAGRIRTLLPALALFVLCVLSLAPAQAQVFRIDPINPATITGGGSATVTTRGAEDVQPQFRVTLTGGTAGVNYSVGVQVQPIDSAAPTAPVDGVDYRANSVPGTITLQPGGTRDFTLRIYDDESFEQQTGNRNQFAFDEQIQLTLNNASAGIANGPNGPGSVIYGITDNDARPRIRVRGVEAAVADRTQEARFPEDNAGQAGQTFQVELIGTSGNAGFRNDGNTLVRTTSIEDVTFDYDYQNGDGTDPTINRTPSQRAPGTATLGTDFQGSFNNNAANGGNGVPGNIPAGQSNTVIPFSIVGDTQDENNESFIVRILNPRNPLGGISSVTNPEGTRDFGVILDDDAPVVTVSDATVTEGNLGSTTRAVFTVELSTPSVQPIQINFTTASGTAIANVLGPNTVSDYQGTSGTLTFAPGETQKTIQVTVNGDNIAEGGAERSENFFIQLFPFGQFPFATPTYETVPNNLSVDNVNTVRTVPEAIQRGLTFINNNTTSNTATGTILDDDTTSISIDDASVVEGDGTGQTTIQFRISLTTPSQNAVTVTASTQPNTAIVNTQPVGSVPNGDFVATSQQVVIAAGATDATFQVPVSNDDLDEVDETFFVNLTNPLLNGASSAGAVIADNQAVGTIVDNDGPQISINAGAVAAATDSPINEGNTGTTPYVFTVSLIAPNRPAGQENTSPQTVTVNYRTVDGTAVSSGVNPDFTPVPALPVQTLTFAPGETTKQITIPVNGDLVFEGTTGETFSVVLSSAVNAAPTPFTRQTAIGTINNDDAIPAVSVGDARAVEGNSISFPITLSNPSAFPITVNFSTGSIAPGGLGASPGADYTSATNGVVTFAAANSSQAGVTAQTVLVATVNDALIEGNETFTFNITASSGNGGSVTVARAQAIGTIVDNDVPSASINNVSVNESAAGPAGTTNATFTITLSSAAPQPITFNVATANGTATAGSDFDAPATQVTIPTGGTTATVTVPVRGDVIAEVNETFTVTITAAPVTGAAAGEIPPVTITNGSGVGTIIDDDNASVIVTPTSGLTTTEAGGTATFTVVLTSQPTANVTIALSSSDTGEGTVSPSTLTFTPATFSTPRTVTITGVDDNLADGNITYTILTGAAQSADPFYANLPVADVTVVNTDNESATLTVSSNAVVVTEGGTTTATVSRNTESNTAALTVNLTASNGNITVPSTVTIPAGQASVNFTVTAPNNFTVDAPRSATVTASALAAGFTASNPLAFQIQDDDSASVMVTPTTLSTSEAGTSATFTVRLNSAPSAAVQINFTSSDTGEVLVAPASVTFTTANFNVPQTITVTGVNDDIADGTQAAAIRGTITSTDTNYAGAAVPAVTVNNADNDTAGFVVTPTSGLTTDETGRTAVFTVAPSTIPQAAVSVEVSSSDTTEGTVSPSRLTFPAGSVVPQTVTVTGVDDAIADGNVAYQVILGVATSTDNSYNGLNPADVSVVNQDNDSASVIVSTRALTTTEAGGTDAFTVALTSQPSADVTITALSTDTTEGVTEPSTLVFNASNFSTPQTVIVRGQNDNLVDGSVQYSIRLAIASNDPGYANQTLPLVQATNVDNDAARVVVTIPAAGIRVNESGTSATFTVALVGQPAANVLLPLSVDKPREARLSASALTFTPENYATPKTVTVTGLDDLIADGNQPFTINLGPTRSNDRAFNLLRPTSVRGVNNDNDRAGVTLAPTTLTLREGARGAIRVTLNSQPTSPVTISLQSSDTTELTVPTSIVLNASNYRAGVAVPITAVLDRVVDGDQQATVRITSQVSADRLYNVPRSAVTGARITVTDADVPSIRVSRTTLSLDENGGSGIVQVALGARPVRSLRVLVTSSSTAVGVVSPTSLIFTPENFSTAQSVTVRAINNNVPQTSPATFNVTTTAVAPGNPYNSVAGTNVVVTVIDDDDATRPAVTIDSPVNGGTFQSVTAVTGTASDDRRIARLTVEVARLSASGAPVAYLQSSGAFTATPASRTVAVSAAGTYALALPTLAVGRYRISTLAVDPSNNSAQATSTFTITDAPTTITITSPLTGGAVNPDSVVRGTVSTRGTLTALTVVVRRNVTVVSKLNVTRSGTGATSTFVTSRIGNLAAGTYTIVATASDAQGNTVSATSTVIVDVTPPTAVNITTPRNNQVVDNIFEVRGTVADNGGGSGLDTVQLVIRRRSVDGFFNGRTFQSAYTTVRATITGSTWVYSLPSGLPADPDPLNAVYSLQAIALDRAGNGVSSTAINVVFSSNGSAGDGVSGTPVTSGNSAVVAQVPASPFFLSTSAANAAQVVLTFSGPINAAKASDVASYEVSIGGALVKLEGVRTAGNAVALLLPEGEAGTGDAISVTYDLRDAQGRALRGKASVAVR